MPSDPQPEHHRPIRKATQGNVTLANTHPFVRELWGRYWEFAKAHASVPTTPELKAASPFGRTGKLPVSRHFQGWFEGQ